MQKRKIDRGGHRIDLVEPCQPSGEGQALPKYNSKPTKGFNSIYNINFPVPCHMIYLQVLELGYDLFLEGRYSPSTNKGVISKSFRETW